MMALHEHRPSSKYSLLYETGKEYSKNIYNVRGCCVYLSAQTTQQYILMDEQGPAHRKTLLVKLQLGNEKFFARGESIRKAQQAAANIAIMHSKLEQPVSKANKKRPQHSLCPTVSCQITLTPYLMSSYQIALTLYPMLCCQTTLTPYLMLCN